MKTTDIGQRLEILVRSNVQGQLLGFIQVARYEDPEREYWENIYIVASKRDDGMTHQANLDSEGDSMLINGHYDMSIVDALRSLIERAEQYDRHLRRKGN